MAARVVVVSERIPPNLEKLQQELETKTHLLASTGDEGVAKVALDLVKDLFELGKRKHLINLSQ